MEIQDVFQNLRLQLSFLAAFLVAFGSLWWAVSRERSKCDRLEIRPPLRRKLRRPAGHSLRQRQSALIEKAVVTFGYTILAGFAPLLFLSTRIKDQWLVVALWQIGVGWMLSAPLTAALVILAIAFNVGAVVYFFYGIRKMLKLIKDTRLAGYGLSGELAVAEVLSDAIGYRAFHDIPDGPYGNVDHVAVGYGGIFVIETKYRSKRAAADVNESHRVTWKGQELQFPFGVDKRAIPQAKANARWLEKEIRERAGLDVSVTPLVVIPGWYVDDIDPTTDHGVIVLNDTNLGPYLQARRSLINDKELTQISRVIIDKVSDIEF